MKKIPIHLFGLLLILSFNPYEIIAETNTTIEITSISHANSVLPDPRLPKQGVKKYNRVQRLLGFGRKARKKQKLALKRQKAFNKKITVGAAWNKDLRNAAAAKLPNNQARNNFFNEARRQANAAKKDRKLGPLVRVNGGIAVQRSKQGPYRLANVQRAAQIRAQQARRAAASPQRNVASPVMGKIPPAPPGSKNLPKPPSPVMGQIPKAPPVPKSLAAPPSGQIPKAPPKGQNLPKPPSPVMGKIPAPPPGKTNNPKSKYGPAPGSPAVQNKPKVIYGSAPKLNNSAPKAPINYSKLPNAPTPPKGPDNRSADQKRADGAAKVKGDLRKTMNASGAPVKAPAHGKLPPAPPKKQVAPRAPSPTHGKIPSAPKAGTKTKPAQNKQQTKPAVKKSPVKRGRGRGGRK